MMLVKEHSIQHTAKFLKMQSGVSEEYQLFILQEIITNDLRTVPPNTDDNNIFAKVMTMGKKQISARATGIQKEKSG